MSDIEIVALPDPDANKQWGLAALLNNHPRTKGKYPGKYLQLKLPQCSLDLFLTTPETWGLIYFIRTGSSEFTQAMASLSKRKGFIWHDGRVYKRGFDLKADKDVPEGEPVDLPEEEDVFKFFGVPWVPPERRTDAKALWRLVRR